MIRTVTFDDAVMALVPREPTTVMDNEGVFAFEKEGYGARQSDARACYRAMIAAAPVIEAETGAGEVELPMHDHVDDWEDDGSLRQPALPLWSEALVRAYARAAIAADRARRATRAGAGRGAPERGGDRG